ncbi:MAG: DUF488 domain-containing protein [Candidatus Adiutrix sp.]|nr:DUF488 domain-containing protein [Candidatus Adiutrix sp.]
MRIFTVGYEGLAIPSFLSSLQEYCIETIVDVRLTPISRKPGFSKSKLYDLLRDVHIDYAHFQALGCPKAIRDTYRHTGDWKFYCQHYLKYLSTQGVALDILANLVDESSCALLCFEADYKYCHRSLIAEALQKTTGNSVDHIVN